jgi:hypothetical protein
MICVNDDSMNPDTIRTLVDIGLSLIPCDIESNRGNRILNLLLTFQRFLTSRISYEETLIEMEKSIKGTRKPLNLLVKFFQITSEPIDRDRKESGNIEKRQ